MVNQPLYLSRLLDTDALVTKLFSKGILIGGSERGEYGIRSPLALPIPLHWGRGIKVKGVGKQSFPKTYW